MITSIRRMINKIKTNTYIKLFKGMIESEINKNKQTEPMI